MKANRTSFLNVLPARARHRQFRFPVAKAAVLAAFACGLIGCGDFKPPTYQDIVGKDDEKSADKKDARTAVEKGAPSKSVAKENTVNAPNPGEKAKSNEPPKKADPAPAPSRTPEQVMADLEANEFKVGSDAEISSLLAALGEKADLVTKLNLDGAKVTPDGMLLLDEFPRLVDLNLSNVSLSSSGWEVLAKLEQLEILNLYRSSITDDDLAAIRGLVQLKELNLSRTKETSDRGHDNLADLANLEVLDISGNDHVTGSNIAQILAKKHGLNKLRVLIANNTRFGTAGMPGLEAQKSLEVVDVGATGLANNGMGGFKGCTNIKELYLGGNQGITNAAMGHVKKMSQMEHLELRNLNGVGNDGIAQLIGLKRMTFINLDGTKVTSDGIRELKKKIPKLEVRYGGKTFE